MDGLPNGFNVARAAGGWPILCTMSAEGLLEGLTCPLRKAVAPRIISLAFDTSSC